MCTYNMFFTDSNIWMLETSKMFFYACTCMEAEEEEAAVKTEKKRKRADEKEAAKLLPKKPRGRPPAPKANTTPK